MIWNLSLYAFLFVFVMSTLIAFFRKKTDKEFQKPVESYLLGNGQLKPNAVVSLLLSTSFGLSYLFYQIWVGYTIGIWGLITQVAWAIGMVLLAKYSSVLERFHSLHELLGERFGKWTRFCAGAFSIVGILFMMGWESGIGVNSLASIYSSSSEMSPSTSTMSASLLVFFVVSGSLLYTIIGGLKGNANADILLNFIKIISVSFLGVILFSQFWGNYPELRWKSIAPPVSVMRANLGWWGMITGIVFSLVWQFVDNSTWQTIRSGAKYEIRNADNSIKTATKDNLIKSGIAAFLAPGIIGTILGIGLISTKSIGQDDIFAAMIALSPTLKVISLVVVFTLIIACIMSLVDGMFLTSSYTLIIDFLYRDTPIDQVDVSKDQSSKVLLKIRISLIVFALLAFFGVRKVYKTLGLELFECFYVMMIIQLCLIGPVLIALTTKRTTKFPIWLALIITAVFGFSLIGLAKKYEISWLTEGAGTFTILFSCLISYFFTKRNTV